MKGIVLAFIFLYFASVKPEVERSQELYSQSCASKDDCDSSESPNDETTKYSNKQDNLVLPQHDKDDYSYHEDDEGIHYTEKASSEQLKPNLPNILIQETDTTNGGQRIQQTKEDSVPGQEATQTLYEFPPLTRIDPVKVGYETEVELEEGQYYKRITRAVYPPVFEVLDFLSEEECQQFIYAGEKLGLKTSGLFGANVNDELNKTDNSEITRISDQAWLWPDNLPTLWQSLMDRLAAAIQMPVDFVYRSEPIQLVKYAPGGHYHAHMDTTDTTEAGNSELPCCFQTRCGDRELTAKWAQCCRLCRYLTVMYYLDDVEKGGETAFPLADMEDTLYNEKTTMPDQRWFNLSKYCYNSSLIVTPRRGSAIFWYTHFRDEETGYLGESDERSYHGGCDIIKGTKWIANNFISAATYEDRFKPSVWYTGPEP